MMLPLLTTVLVLAQSASQVIKIDPVLMWGAGVLGTAMVSIATTIAIGVFKSLSEFKEFKGSMTAFRESVDKQFGGIDKKIDNVSTRLDDHILHSA